MVYKITYNKKSYIVKAKDAQSAIDGLSILLPEIKDDRLSPMTYKKLKELGYGREDWKNLTQEQANKIVQQNKSESSSNNKSELNTDIDKKVLAIKNESKDIRNKEYQKYRDQNSHYINQI